jgi:hypothetical protein
VSVSRAKNTKRSSKKWKMTSLIFETPIILLISSLKRQSFSIKIREQILEKKQRQDAI